jgi:2-succinyl-6-hydroxy-2,4-cyclohexadiene-1-carboxylate synthase
VRSLVLVGATAGIADAAERSDRRAADEHLADHIESVGVEAFIDEWLRNPLFAGLTADTSQRDDRLRNTAAGLASSLRSTGTGTQQPLWDRLHEISAPVLVLAGERDAKFREIGERMTDSLPDATFRVIPDAGHSVHLERPEATAEAIAEWLLLRAPDRR